MAASVAGQLDRYAVGTPVMLGKRRQTALGDDALGLTDLDVDQHVIPEAVEEMENQSALAVEESGEREIAIGPIEKRPDVERKPGIHAIPHESLEARLRSELIAAAQ